MFAAIQDRLKELIDGIKGEEEDDSTKLSESLCFENAVISTEPVWSDISAVSVRSPGSAWWDSETKAPTRETDASEPGED